MTVGDEEDQEWILDHRASITELEPFGVDFAEKRGLLGPELRVRVSRADEAKRFGSEIGDLPRDQPASGFALGDERLDTEQRLDHVVK